MKFVDYFSPEVGETKASIVGKLEAMMDQLREYAKKGYEHDPNASSGCTNFTVVNGDKKGGWVHPKTGRCNACGFYVGKVASHVSALEELLVKFKELPDDYRYGV